VEAAMVESTTPDSPSSGGSEQPPPATSSPSEPHMPDVTAETTTRLVPPTDDLSNKTIINAPAPAEMIPRGLPTIDLLAHILVGKFADKLPFNRQEGITVREGVPITRGTMCGWAEGAHELAHHVVDAMVEDARANAHVIATDATGVLVQANEKCKHGHFWV